MHGVDFVDTGGAQKTGGVDFMAAEIVTELLAGCFVSHYLRAALTVEMTVGSTSLPAAIN